MSRFRLSVGALLVAFLLWPNASHAQQPAAQPATQPAVITGKVTTEFGQPLQGANVYITEMAISVPTNAAGSYSITIVAARVQGQQVVLRVRGFGYSPQSRPIRITPGAQVVDFGLKQDVNRLEAIVVTGVTGATSQKDLAFAVTKLESADIPVQMPNALAQLQGKVPGATVVMPSGRPGVNPSINIRGPKMINAEGRSQAPLVIVDGVVTAGNIQDINPDDIESMEVVKGAAGASTFGSRAANGVISITTKSGKNNVGLRYNARTEYGFNDVQSEYPYAQRHMLMMDETNTRFCLRVTGLPACSRTVDFEEEALRINENGPTTNALSPWLLERDYGIGNSPTKPELRGLFLINQWPVRYNPIGQAVTNNPFIQQNGDISGRVGNTSFYSSVSYLNQEGAIKYLKGYQRQTARLNLDQQVGEDVQLSFANAYTRATLYPNSAAFFRLTRVPASVDLLRRDKYGRLFPRSNPMNQGQQNENPLYDNEQLQGQTNSDRYLGSLRARYTPASWLDLDANAAIDRSTSSGWSMLDRGFRLTAIGQGTGIAGAANSLNGFMSSTSDNGTSYNVSMQATARQNNPFGFRDLDVRWNVRYAYEQEDNDSYNSGGNTLAVPGLRSLDNVTVVSNPGSSFESIRAIAGLGGVALDYKSRYALEGAYRVDGSSLFGSESRYAPYWRGSFAWQLSEEPWFPFDGAISFFKLRSAVGTAGGRPRFSAQYETFSIGTGGTVTGNAKGNKLLKPETTTETEYGVDAELFGKYGVNVTYARDITRDAIIQVPPSVSTGFSSQWQNAGQLDNNTWEASLNIPIISKKNVLWSTRISYDRNRSVISALGVPEFFQSDAASTFKFAVGERIGTIWGKRFVTSCSELPAQFQPDCGGDGKSYQRNNEGYIVWTGGLSPSEGVTRNGWQSALPGCMKNGAPINQTGEVNCRSAGGTINNPWAIPLTNWGMLIVIRDSTGNPILDKLGNTQPDFRLSMSHTFSYKRFSAYVLADGWFNRKMFNEEIHWSLGDFNVRYEDQDGQSVETAKPIGYFWRAPQPDGAGTGVGGFYDVLGGNIKTVQNAAFTKLREVNLSYNVGSVRGIGDWTVSVIGRNLYTFTDFLGWDPEAGGGGTSLNSGAIGGVAAFQYPQTRQFTLALGSRF